MNWNNLHEATADNAKPAPGWLFKEICQDARQYPQDVPDTAEYLMRCVACDTQTVSMKACLAVRHLADEVPEFRVYMQRCPEALDILSGISEPPQLAIAASLERMEAKVAREAAARALASCLASVSEEQLEQKEQMKQRIQGFGNFAPPDPAQAEPAGVVNKVAGLVGDAVGDTIDDFREKGAVGAVRDGVADAADLILDGVGAVWDFLGGRKNRAAKPPEDRICKPADQLQHGNYFAPQGFPAAGLPAGAGLAALGLGATPGAVQGAAGAWTAGAAPYAAAPAPAASAYQGAFGKGIVGAGHAFHPSLVEGAGGGATSSTHGYGFAPPAPLPAQTAQTAPPQAAAAAAATSSGSAAPALPPDDLLSFDDEPSPRGASSATADLLSFGDAGAQSQAPGAGSSSGPEPDMKTKGNDLVRQHKYADAVQAYEAALAALDGQPGGQPGALRAALFANLALCYLRQQLYRRAVDAATRSIEHDATHAKAYYRRCLAHKGLKMFAEAKRDLDALQFCRHEMTEAEMQRLHVAISAGLGSSPQQ